MTETERFAWLQLAFSPYIGAESFAALVQVYGSATEALTAPSQAITQLGRFGKQAAAAWNDMTLAKTAAENALNWEAKSDSCRLLLSCDEDFPMRLSEGMTAPPVLFVRGNTNLLRQTSIGIVGSRQATPQAMRIAHDFAKALSEKDITIISGMASGIDTAAHQGAIQHSGSTIAIWGTGIDRIYPPSNRDLAHEIAEKGLIISEFPLGTRPLAGNFPRRNRIIAAQSTGVLVVEAALESGSLITARQAAEMGREVMAIPGSIDNPHSKGCHKLIKEGAKLVECLDDILQELENYATDTYPQNIVLGREFSGSLNKNKRIAKNNHNLFMSLSTNVSTEKIRLPENENEPELLRQMGYDPIHPDALAEQTGIATADIYAQLTEWELDGKVSVLAGGRYQRIA